MDSHSIPPKTSQLSGQWTGFWSDPHTRQKHQMRCTIRFINSAFQGHGEDEVELSGLKVGTMNQL